MLAPCRSHTKSDSWLFKPIAIVPAAPTRYDQSLVSAFQKALHCGLVAGLLGRRDVKFKSTLFKKFALTALLMA